MTEEFNYPRIRDLPKEEQEKFNSWLDYRGRPLPSNWEDLPPEEWDWFYPWDYEKWKGLHAGHNR